MGLPAYIVTNLVANPPTFTLSTEDATYTRTNLYDGRQNKPFRFTAKATQTILMDFASAVTIDFVAVIKHNWTSGGAYSLKFGTTSSVADGTETLTHATKNIYKSITSQSKRYWRLDVSDAGNSAMPELGELYLG